VLVGRRRSTADRGGGRPRQFAFAFRELKLVVEPAGAAALAALLAASLDVAGRTAVVRALGWQCRFPELFARLVA